MTTLHGPLAVMDSLAATLCKAAECQHVNTWAGNCSDCMNDGLAVSCAEEHELVVALDRVRRAIAAMRAISDAPPMHTVEVTVEDGGTYGRMTCPFDPADDTRPCWPYTEEGEPEPADTGAAYGCTWESWYGNTGGELLRPFTLVLDVPSADWSEGDHPMFDVSTARMEPDQ